MSLPAYFWLIVAFLGEWGLYWLAWRMAGRLHGRLAWSIVILGMLAFSLALLWMAPFDAADIYDNIMHGRILWGCMPPTRSNRSSPNIRAIPALTAVWQYSPRPMGRFGRADRPGRPAGREW